MYDVYKVRKDFPILDLKINGKINTFMDSAASAQKPLCVICITYIAMHMQMCIEEHTFCLKILQLNMKKLVAVSMNF